MERFNRAKGQPRLAIIIGAAGLLCSLSMKALPEPADPLPALSKATPAQAVPAAAPGTKLSEVLDGLIGSDHIVWLSTKTGRRRLGTFQGQTVQGQTVGRFIFQHLHFIKGAYYPNGLFGGTENYYFRDGEAVAAIVKPMMIAHDWTYDHVMDKEKIDPAEVVSVDELDPPLTKSGIMETPPTGTGGFSGGQPGWRFIFYPWKMTRVWPVPIKTPENKAPENKAPENSSGRSGA